MVRKTWCVLFSELIVYQTYYYLGSKPSLFLQHYQPIVASNCSEIVAGNSCSLRLSGVFTDTVKLSLFGADSGTSEVASLLISKYYYDVLATP